MDERKTRPIPDKVTHYKQLKEGEYLGAWDLVPDKDIPVTIETVQQEEVFNPGNNKKEWKNVARFKDKTKGVILNSTNMDAIASLYGNNPKDWPGKVIALYRGTTKLRGVPVECIRIRAKSASQKAVESVK
jgi:hypothetical protein